MEERPRRVARRARCSLLLAALVLVTAGGPRSRSSVWAAVCSTASSASSLRIDSLAAALELNAAVNCTSGGQLNAVWAGTVALDTQISIGTGTFLSIMGEDELAEVHGGLLGTRLFGVAAGGGLSLTQLKLVGGTADNGGALYSSMASVTLDSCVFEGNIASDGDGGAVWAEGGDVTIIAGEFVGNNASLGFGGAVHVNGVILSIQNGTWFEDNTSVQGGALYCSGDGLVGLTTNTTTATSDTALVAASCSLWNATFVSNRAASPDTAAVVGWTQPIGGAATFENVAEVHTTDCLFAENWAQSSAGALYAGNDTALVVDGCTFRNNTSPSDGGAIAASVATLGRGTELRYNSAGDIGGAVSGWDPEGSIDFEDVLCRDNTAINKGGCFYVAGRGTIGNGTVMLGNVAGSGGCIYAIGGSNVSVNGGKFTCESTGNGGFVFASDGARVNITGGDISNNVALKRGAAVYCSGNSFDLEGSQVFIEGGVFTGNEALELGAGIVAWGDTTVVTITGGIFEKNIAKYYGGFIFLEEGASLTCEGAMIRDNHAGDQGGGIYARGATWVNVSGCDLIGNESPQGAASYLFDVRSVSFDNMDIAGSVLAVGGSAIFVAESAVVAKGVTATSETAAEEAKYSSYRAILIDDTSTLEGEECIFNGWHGDSVIQTTSAKNGSLVLTSCDFSGSSPEAVVLSPNSDAEIRNAVIGDLTLKNAADPLKLVDKALVCGDPNACGGAGVECVDDALGVLCACLPDDGGCLNGAGALSLDVKTPLSPETYDPDPVEFELVVSAAEDGTTNAIWDLAFEADDLFLTAVPSSGIVPPGGNVTVAVTGTALRASVDGNLASRFVLASIAGSRNDSITSGAAVELEVVSTFYFCPAFQYAVPVDGDDENDINIECLQCQNINGAAGVDCDQPGATLASLPLLKGYWRSGTKSSVIHSCLNKEACGGATVVASSDDYCAEGYAGPYCAVCTEGYGQIAENTCHSCQDANFAVLVAAGTVFSVLLLLALSVGTVYLIGGLEALCRAHDSLFLSLAGPISNDQPIGRAVNTGTCSPSDHCTVAVAPSFDCNSVVVDHTRGGGGNGYTEPEGRGSHNRGPDKNVTGDDISIVFWPCALGTVKTQGAGVVGVGQCNVPRGDTRAGYQPRVYGDRNRCCCGFSRCGDRRHRNPAAGGDAESRVGGAADDREQGTNHDDGSIESGRRCAHVRVIGRKLLRWASRIRRGKIKILVVVWQILTVFPSITGVDYPHVYEKFLSAITFVNFDLAQVFSASCFLPTVVFYDRLIATTLMPLILVGGLVVTYQIAMRKAGGGSEGLTARRAAWSRHVAAGLLLTFLVFTSASTTVFKAFACDDEAVKGESFLRADYSVSCNSAKYASMRVYAAFMVLVYPIGIPVLYFFTLWMNRSLLNPSAYEGTPESRALLEEGQIERTGTAYDTSSLTIVGFEDGGDKRAASMGQGNDEQTKEDPLSLEERIRLREDNQDLAPSKFPWKDFGPNTYYFEVVECGRRILLTGVLVFIAPQDSAQAATSCIFAFSSLLGFELLRPHLDPADSWVYRLGCVIIFLSNFLGLLIKLEAAGAGGGAILGGTLVFTNVVLLAAVLGGTLYSTQQQVDKAGDLVNVTAHKAISEPDEMSPPCLQSDKGELLTASSLSGPNSCHQRGSPLSSVPLVGAGVPPSPAAIACSPGSLSGPSSCASHERNDTYDEEEQDAVYGVKPIE